MRDGAPDTIDDGEGWVHHGAFSVNLMLACTFDGRFVLGASYGPPFSVLDTRSGEIYQVAVDVDGHPTWAAAHPRMPVIAVFSRTLDIIDVESRNASRRIHLPDKLSGEYLPDGRLLIASTLGLLLWDDEHGPARLRVLLDPPPAVSRRAPRAARVPYRADRCRGPGERQGRALRHRLARLRA